MREQLAETGINPDAVVYLIGKVFSTQGVILVADSSILGDPNECVDAE